jgi:hypothetical protein
MDPFYFRVEPDRLATAAYDGGFYASQHYPVGN